MPKGPRLFKSLYTQKSGLISIYAFLGSNCKIVHNYVNLYGPSRKISDAFGPQNIVTSKFRLGSRSQTTILASPTLDMAVIGLMYT